MKKFNLQSDWFRLLVILFIAIIIGGLIFLFNNITGLFNILVVIIQAILGLIFAAWYVRIFLAYYKEIRRKDEMKKIGIQKGWAIFGIIDSIINIFTWGVLSSLIFNVPKIIYFVPFTLSIIQTSYLFYKANRRYAKDWFLLLYNIVAYLYLFNWTLVDFGIDLPNILGIFSHTINSGIMWWQLVYINTAAFFIPTFLFPPYILNPRYYLAMPVEEYYKIRDEEEKKILDPLKPTKKELDIFTDEIGKKLPGERTPFFDKRKKIETEKEIETALQKEKTSISDEEDIRFAEFISLRDFSVQIRRFIKRLDSITKNFSIGIILILIIITPVAFAGIVSLNVLPNYRNQTYTTNPNMVLAVKGNVFSNYDLNGNITNLWEIDLTEEISLAKELHATHLRYDINSRGLINNLTKANLATGLQIIKDEGIKLILELTPNQADNWANLQDTIYKNCSYIVQNFKPDYLIILNEFNGELGRFSLEEIDYKEVLNQLTFLSTNLKLLNPTTKIGTTLLAVNDDLDIFETVLTNSSLNIDFVGINYYPVLFGWRSKLLSNFASVFINTSSTVDFWISEIGIESFNFGENAQAKYLAHIASLSSSPIDINADGLCIVSLIDNLGYSKDQGIVSHLGLVYFNGQKKKAFHTVVYAYGKIQGLL